MVIGVSYAFDNIAALFGVQIGFFGRNDPFMERGSVNFLIVGVDSFTLADLIMVAQYDFETGNLNVLQVPRDTYSDTDRWDKKINSAFAMRGIDTFKHEVTQITGIEIDRYIIVQLNGFRNIIDAIGGVEMYVPIRMFYTDPTPGHELIIDLQRGQQTLNGAQAEMFMRFRKNDDGTGYAEGDMGRMAAQRQFYAAVINQLVSVRGALQLPRLMGIVQENVRTNLTGDEMVRYLGIGLRADMEKFNIIQLPGQSRYISGVSYFIHDVELTRTIIYEYFTPRRNSNTRQSNGEVRINRNKNSAIRLEIVDSTGVEIYGVGIGETVAELLRDNAFDVRTVRVCEPREQTLLVDRNNKQASAEILKILSNLDVWLEADRGSNYDVTVFLGGDFSL